MTTSPKLYVGCALTDAPEKFKEDVEHIKSDLRENGYEVLDFIGLIKGTPVDVYEWDLGHCVGKCDVFVGICDFPSTGLGVEIRHALELGKPILLVAHKDAKVTRLILGAAEKESTIRFERYNNLSDIVPWVTEIATSR